MQVVRTFGAFHVARGNCSANIWMRTLEDIFQGEELFCYRCSHRSLLKPLLEGFGEMWNNCSPSYKNADLKEELEEMERQRVLGG